MARFRDSVPRFGLDRVTGPVPIWRGVPVTRLAKEVRRWDPMRPKAGCADGRTPRAVPVGVVGGHPLRAGHGPIDLDDLGNPRMRAAPPNEP